MLLDFKKNLNTFDRVIRVLIGIYTLWLVFTQTVTGFWAVFVIFFALHMFAGAVLSY